MAKKEAAKAKMKRGWKGRQPKKAETMVPQEERVADGIVKTLRRVHRRNA